MPNGHIVPEPKKSALSTRLLDIKGLAIFNDFIFNAPLRLPYTGAVFRAKIDIERQISSRITA